MKIIQIPLLVATLWMDLFSAVHPAGAQTWIQTTAPALYWNAVASSADGKTLVGVVDGGDIYTSTNWGTTWSFNGLPYLTWRSVAASADGTRLIAVGYHNLFTSTNSGIAWTSNAIPSVPFLNAPSIASSGDGTVFAAGSDSTYIFISTNSGINWFERNIPEADQNLALSADGKYLLAATAGLIYVSTNLGKTWAATTAPRATWVSLAGSANAANLVAASSTGIYTSTNSGTSWQTNSIPGDAYASAACSADGATWAVASQSALFVSTNNGVTWTSPNPPPTNWWGVALSADGSQLVAIPASRSPIWIARIAPKPPRLNVKSFGTEMTLAWPVPSTNFVLQQSSDLAAWSGLTNTPVLNFTNLQNEVTLEPTGSIAFYRLRTP
jgi:photosystem II stability/assembly factor-like uncharacterized protein